MNTVESSPSRMGGANVGLNGSWKVSDSFKKNKLRVTSREEVKKKREAEAQRNKSQTSDAKSYLKSRRQKAREEKRQNILGILDDNLDRLDSGTTSQHEELSSSMSSSVGASRANKTGKHYHNSRKNNHPNSPSYSCSRKSASKDEKNSHNRFRSLLSFRNKSKSDITTNAVSGKRDYFKRTKSDRRTTRRRKEQKEAIENIKQNKDKDADMQDILEEVLRKYPKEKCRTFADHKEFAFAELTMQSNQKKDLQMDAEKFNDLKTMLQKHLSTAFGEDESVANSKEILDKQQRRQNRHSHSATSKRRSTRPASPSSPSKTYLQVQNDASHKSPPRPSMTQNSSISPQRTRSTVPAPAPMPSPRKSPVKERNKVLSPSSQTPKSSKSLALPAPRNSTMRLAPFIEKDDHTSTTEKDDDESTLVPVVKLLIVDPTGQVGKYSGTICVNTGKPHGSGRLEYEDSGSYQGDWNQGNWSGFGRHIKPNGDMYEGNFFDNAKHGMGVYRYRDGKRVFEGRYVMGQRVDGQMTYGDSSVYKGQWYEGKRHGRGTYRFKDSSLYKGEFQHDVIHGVGQLVWPDGAKYIGEWNQGHRHGMGKEYTADGRLRYDGKWKDSVPVP